MTEKQVYENVLTECRKVKSPSLHLEDYNYWGNKGIQEYCNERYNQFAMSQQLSDDLQPLTTSAVFVLPTILPTGTWSGGVTEAGVAVSFGKKYGSDFYRFKTPDNYWHMLGSHVTSVSLFNYKCHPAGFESQSQSKRLTQDIANGVMNNAFLKPAINRPYHSFGDGANANIKPDLFYFIGDSSKFGLKSIYIDYLKEPRKINLTVQQRDLPVDTSIVMEFPDYACNEIIKRIVKLVLESSSDPRLQTKIAVDTSIP